MIVCAMDDLIFSIKIQTAAKAIGGIDLFFERSADMILPRLREKRPTLVIFDLNSTRLNPMAAIAQLKADPELREILFDLETAVRSVHQASGKTPLFDLLAKTRTNLLRMWAED